MSSLIREEYKEARTAELMHVETTGAKGGGAPWEKMYFRGLYDTTNVLRPLLVSTPEKVGVKNIVLI